MPACLQHAHVVFLRGQCFHGYGNRRASASIWRRFEHFKTQLELASAVQNDGQRDHHTPKPFVRLPFANIWDRAAFSTAFSAPAVKIAGTGMGSAALTRNELMQEPQPAGQFFAQNLQYLLRHLRMLLAERVKTFATQGERD